MKRCLLALLALMACSGATSVAPSPSAATSAPPAVSNWSPSQIAVLRHWVAAAPEDALPVLATTDLDHALAGADKAAIDKSATVLALRLARMPLLGGTRPAAHLGWHLTDADATIDVPARLAQALGSPPAGPDAGLDRFFAGLRPQHPDYAASHG